MRTSSIFAIFCLTVGIIPSFALPSTYVDLLKTSFSPKLTLPCRDQGGEKNRVVNPVKREERPKELKAQSGESFLMTRLGEVENVHKLWLETDPMGVETEKKKKRNFDKTLEGRLNLKKKTTPPPDGYQQIPDIDDETNDKNCVVV
ncbi:hypothetical protein F5148DRAFT_1262138 [Russula earlei]|uniref:Uncharacterized protein n=1 Tax=Russula earlei TaxID=71964 RepID=A0ACC0TRW8_9AGAM|nr:hypothetical protein F5148DRAFT_1262138 [Russula earlei]